jgi:hypothetical protein
LQLAAADPHFHQNCAKAVFCEVQTVFRRSAGQADADIEHRRLAVGARAQHGIDEGHRRRFRPADVLAEAGSIAGEVWQAGPAHHRAHLLVSLFHPELLGGVSLRGLEGAPVLGVHAAGIERGQHFELGAHGGELLANLQPGLVNALVHGQHDVRAGDGDETFRPEFVAYFDQDLHRQLAGFAFFAGKHRLFRFRQ